MSATESAAPNAYDLTATAKGVKGQLATVGTAFTSAYGKAKDAIISPWQADVGSSDPVSLSSTPSSAGPEIFVALGQLNESQGEYAKALNNYTKALEVEEKNLAALSATARLFDKQNRPDDAIQFYQRAIDVAGTDASLHVELGDCYRRANQLDAAKKSYLAATNLEPKNRQHRIAMAGLLLDQGQSAEAYDELLQTDSPAMANYQMAFIQFRRQNVPAAQNYLAKALEIDPALKPARELSAQIGNSRLASRAVDAYQTGSQVVANLQGLARTQPNASPNQMSTTQAGVVEPIVSNGPSPQRVSELPIPSIAR